MIEQKIVKKSLNNRISSFTCINFNQYENIKKLNVTINISMTNRSKLKIL